MSTLWRRCVPRFIGGDADSVKLGRTGWVLGLLLVGGVELARAGAGLQDVTEFMPPSSGRPVSPDWLKRLEGNGCVVKSDSQSNVVSIYVGARADDAFLAGLKTLPQLRELTIEATKCITPGGLEHLAELPALEALSLYLVNEGKDGLGDAALKAAVRIRTLKHLSIAECGATDEGVRTLEGASQLISLSLRGNTLSDAGVKFLAGLTHLRQLDLSQTMWVNSRMRITDEGLKHLAGLTELRELSIDGLSQVTDNGLRHLSRLTQLRSLSFAGSSLSGKSMPFPRLETLALSGDGVTDATLDSISDCRDLQTLTLKYTRVSDAGLARIAELKALRGLKLSSRCITDEGIARLRGLPALEHLELRATQISDASLRSLAGIKSLARLDLYGSGGGGATCGRLFTVDGLLEFKALPNLRELWISNLELPEGCLALRELRQLKALTFFFCNVTDDEERLLKAAMPKTAVTAAGGGGKWDVRKPPVSLPDNAVRITGRAVDEATGQPVRDCTLEFGVEDPATPGAVVWGELLPGERLEVAGNDPRDTSRFWGESFRPGKVWARLLASGYLPASLTPRPGTAPLNLTNRVVRLKRGGDFRGLVLDHAGRPAPGIRVCLDNKPGFRLNNGQETHSGHTNFGLTDANGRFVLSGGNGTAQRLVAASADGQLFQIEPRAKPDQDLVIQLPQPATLILHYDIPDDLPLAEFVLNFNLEALDPAVWKNTSFGLQPVVTNRGELVLTNLTPGAYSLARRKMLQVGGGRRFQFLDGAAFTLNSGQTQRVDVIRPAGQAIRGRVTGIEAAGAVGAYLYAVSGEVTNAALNCWQPGPLTDLGTCLEDGVFQTARLPPGTYSIVAMAFKEPNVYAHSGDADFIGVAKVAVTADQPPRPVQIPLQAWKPPN